MKEENKQNRELKNKALVMPIIFYKQERPDKSSKPDNKSTPEPKK